METKYYLIKVKHKGFMDDNIETVELTEEDIDTITHDNYYVKSIKKFRKVLDNENKNS